MPIGELNEPKHFLTLKAAFIILVVMLTTFAACVDAYFLYNATDEGLAFIFVAVAAALVVDVAI